MGFTGSILPIKLKSTDNVIFSGLPVGASYTVTEAEAFTDIIPDDPEDLSATLNYKNDWSVTFEDLPKYGTLKVGTEDQTVEYKYYITEFEVTGFKNMNDEYPDYSYAHNDHSDRMRDEASFVLEDENYKNGVREITFINQQIPTCSLSPEKQVRGNFGSKATKFDLNIEFKDENGVPINSTGFIRVDMDAQGNVLHTPELLP
ncbi:hypothetical protein [Ruminococcus sp.]|uniref:hypothetical protein n=1 Tax=Ruminococcus sp. TaxID=41978 RepID=UPI0025E927EA|nr:hypothetical protein [Ruminococcus sp.]MBQ8967136.1 hypothetical protein [Ruminococcus sp.]